MPLVFHVEVFVLGVPPGTFSGNEEFWKRIDEQCVDVPTYDLLYKNGIRVGVAPTSELDDFAKYMNDVAPVEKISMNGSEVKDAQIEMKKDLPEQVIFHFDRQNNAIGRSFDRSENFWDISFEPAPRKPGQLRLTLCPMIRASRRQVVFTQLNEGYEMKFVSPEMIYDLNFRVDIPAGGFLVVTPSPNARRPTSVGNAFLVKDGPTSKLEQVLIIIPKQLRVDQSDRPTIAH